MEKYTLPTLGDRKVLEIIRLRNHPPGSVERSEGRVKSPVGAL